MKNNKQIYYLPCVLMFLFCACGPGGDGDGNISVRADARDGGTVIVSANNPDNVSDIIDGNNQDTILNCTACCKRCDNDPSDGVSDNTCRRNCREKHECDTLNAVISECLAE